jgi:hypothetical protein
MGLRKLLRARHRAIASKREPPLHLQVLFPHLVTLSTDALARTLRGLHPSLAQVSVEMRTGVRGPGAGLLEQMAQVRWARHTVHVAFLSVPAPPEVLEQTIEPAHYEEELKEQAAAHTAHAILIYQGAEPDPLEQYLALAKIAAALVPLGAIVALNPSAFTSYPARDLVPRPGEELDQVLHTLPLLALFVGFVKVKVEGVEGLWIRTCGAPLLNMPDLALHTHDEDTGQRAFLMFKDIFAAMRSTQVRFSAGDRVEDNGMHWKFRKPRASEGFLHSSRMIVLEPEPPSGLLG